MTPDELRDQIVTLATDIKKRSSSPTVDGWADQLVVLAGEIPTLAPPITERRQGERRSVNQFDDVATGDRRTMRRAP